MPAEITAAPANIHEDCIWIAASKETFDLARLRRGLIDVVKTFKGDLGDSSSRKCLVVALIIAAMEFTKLDPLYESLAILILIVISYFFRLS